MKQFSLYCTLILSPTIFAGSVGGFGGATEVTQYLNYTTLISQLDNQISMLNKKLKSIALLNVDASNPIVNHINNNNSDIQRILNNTNAMNYSIGNVSNQYNQLFPPGINYATIDHQHYSDYYQNWNQELAITAQVAAESQAIIQRIQQSNQQSISILQQSATADGEVRQLQLQNQSLALVSDHLSHVKQLLATSGRVTAVAAAQATAEKQREHALAQQAIENYTDPGTATNVFTELPRFKSS